MAIEDTHYKKNTASDLSVPGDDFDDLVAAFNIGATSETISIATNSTETSYGFSHSDGLGFVEYDNSSWSHGIDVTTGDSDVDLRIRAHRISSSGTVLASSGWSSSQTLTTGAKTFVVGSPQDLGPFEYSDRFRIDYEFTNTRTHGGAQSVTIDFASLSSGLDVPLSSPPRTGSLMGAGHG